MSIIGLDGLPLPSPQIVERLQRIDPGLGLRFIVGTKVWAITCKWSLMDPRRQLIQEGKIAPDDNDIFAFLPEDCSADEAFGYLERHFVRNSGKEEIRKLLNRLDEYNDRTENQNLEPTVELAEELIRTNAPTLFKGKHIPKSTKIGPKSKKDEAAFQEYLRG